LPCDDHSRTITETQKSSERIEEKVAALPCDDHKEAIFNFRQTANQFDFKLDIFKNSFDAAIQSMIASRKSPYTLTEAGEKFLELSGGKKCVDENIDYFISELRQTKPQTAYDVEINARAVLINNKGERFFNPIKDYVYVAPKTINIDGVDVNTSFVNVILSMELYLRDKYLELHPELIPEAIAEQV
jgi:hypothetical protein